MPHLAPDFAYIHEASFYGPDYFRAVYDRAFDATQGFTAINEEHLVAVLEQDSRTLLAFRTILGLTREEFAHSTVLAAEPLDLPPVSAGKVDSMERQGSSCSRDQAQVAARTISEIMNKGLFGNAPHGLLSKQAKLDTQDGWQSVRKFASEGVPFADFLHQRHYGGAFRQVLDATSTRRGNLTEEAVEELFQSNRIQYIRTGSNNQAEIASRFEVRVAPAPDFVVFDSSGVLRAMLECKGTNNGGTARDKALRFERLREESVRLGGVPLFAVLGGMGWTRVNDALGPVIRDTQGRVFTIATLQSMLDVSPFPTLIGIPQ